MGYFSNGTEGMIYEERWCNRCVHQSAGCAVWMAHLLYAYNGTKEQKEMLNIFIPRSKDGLANLKCRMFKSFPNKPDPDDGEPLLFERHEIGGKPIELKKSA